MTMVLHGAVARIDEYVGLSKVRLAFYDGRRHRENLIWFEKEFASKEDAELWLWHNATKRKDGKYIYCED